MIYNYFFEIAAILVMLTIVIDYCKKIHIGRTDANIFRIVVYVSLAECVVNVLSSVLIAFTASVPLWVNIAVATLFFILQAGTIYSMTAFCFAYINPHFSTKSKGFIVITVLFACNLLFAILSPITKFYFYFDAEGRYIQGVGSNMGYYFFLISMLFCVGYGVIMKERLLQEELKAVLWTATLVGLGAVMQFVFRSVLSIGFSYALAELYLYITLENPNDNQDKLTQCGNQYAFKQVVDRKCTQNKVFSVIAVDLKRFRYVNSLYGIEKGDMLLKGVAAYLMQRFKREKVFRVNNDLFTVIVSGSQTSVRKYVGKILERFDLPWQMGAGKECLLEPAVVVCEYPRYFQSHTELLKLQSDMSRRVKDSHDQSALFCEQVIADRCRREEEVEKALKNALISHTLEVYYQPIVDSKEGEVVALEALARMHDPYLGTISPDEFIAVAEKTGDIVSLGFYVLDSVCAFIKEHLLGCPCSMITCVHVNLSMLQCAYPRLTMRFTEIINKYGIPASMIHLELTESSMIESPEMVRDAMERLRKFGIEFALDDYGTGYSNISYLVQFPFEQIKFDKNMVWSYFEKDEVQIIMQNEFETLRQLHKDIIVEGIETKEQCEAMEKCGIHLFQGYYFAKALPNNACLEFLKKWNEKQNV